MLDITTVIRTLVPAYPTTVKPGGKEVPATFRISPADTMRVGDARIIPGKDRGAPIFLCTVNDKTEILCARKADGFARRHKFGALPPHDVKDDTLVSLSMTGGKDPRWCAGKGAARVVAHKEEIKAGVHGLAEFVCRLA